jgi:hypothetical protein
MRASRRVASTVRTGLTDAHSRSAPQPVNIGRCWRAPPFDTIGGAVTPYNRQARAPPPPAAATGARHAPITRKRPIERAAQDGRLLGAVPRTSGTTRTSMPQRDVTRLRCRRLCGPRYRAADRRPYWRRPGRCETRAPSALAIPSDYAQAPSLRLRRSSRLRMESLRSQDDLHLADRLQHMLGPAMRLPGGGRGAVVGAARRAIAGGGCAVIACGQS